MTVATLPSEPYVGMRPFASEERSVFFGRERDAQILTDRILSARLTVLYAQSGVGKSSLLRAAVMPGLSQAGALVVYFDAWSSSDASASLRQALIDCATELNVPDAGRGSPTLIELARMITTSRRQSLIIVLDQFEEFLAHHAQRLNTLRHDLAGLVRASGIDVTVVLSLREEFLAALEPLRGEILDLFQSTYRLEGLGEEDLRTAIMRPTQLFGGVCEKDLADRLIRDLPVDESAAAGSASVQLPMLQLICKELWNHALDDQDASRVMSMTLYDRLGGAQAILGQYVRSVMPGRHRQAVFTARLMRYLAPPSGLKLPYSPDDLADATALPVNRIVEELRRLANARILRVREYGASQRYELQHDALIKIVRPWQNQVLKTEASHERLRLVMKTAIVAAALTGAVWYSLDRQRQRFEHQQAQQAESHRVAEAATQDTIRTLERQRQILEIKEEANERWQSGGQLEDALGGADPTRLESVADYYLRRKTGSDRLDALKTVLKQYQYLLPKRYAEQNADSDEVMTEPAEDWVLQIGHAPQWLTDVTDRDIFLRHWRTYAQYVARSWGIPAPIRVHLTPVAGLGPTRLRVSNPAGSTTELNLQDFKDSLVLTSTQRLHPQAREFHDRFRGDWKRLTPQKDLIWWQVPRWSVPIWKLGGESVTGAMGLAAFDVFQHLLKNPEALFSQPAVEYTLQRVSELYPQTVSEARLARNTRLSQDFSAVVRDGRALHGLPEFLDLVADRAGDDSTAIAKAFDIEGWMEADVRLPRKLSGPWKPVVTRAGLEVRKQDQPFREVEAHLEPITPPIRVYVAPGLLQAHFPSGKLSPSLSEGIEGVRVDSYRTYGIRIPGVRFFDGYDLKANTVRLEVLSERAGPNGAKPTLLQGPQNLTPLFEEFENLTDHVRMYWITAESSHQALESLPTETNRHLRRLYSVSDIKTLLRAVVAPPGQSVRYTPWLLRALAFWALVESDPLSVARMSDRLKQTARGSAASLQQTSPDVQLAIDRGVQALLEDHVDAAVTNFSAAIKIDSTAASRAFATAWVRGLRRAWLADFEKTPVNIDRLVLTSYERMDLQDLLRNSPHDATFHRLRVYLLAAGAVASRNDQEAILHDLLRHATPADLPLTHGRWIAERFLASYDPTRHDSVLFTSANTFLRHAITTLDERDSYAVFTRQVELAQTTATLWRWQLLEDLAALRPNGTLRSLPLALAFALCEEERTEKLMRALALATQVESQLTATTLAPEERNVLAADLRYVRATANHRLAVNGDQQRWKEPEEVFGAMMKSERASESRNGHAGLIRLLGDLGRHNEADAVIAIAARRWPGDVVFSSLDMFTQLSRGRKEDVARIATAAVAEADKKGGTSTDTWLFLASLGQLLTAAPGWQDTTDRFLQTNHQNKDYVLALYYSQLGGSKSQQAQDLLKARFATVQRSNWPARLQAGDMSAWREMLLSRFMNVVGEAEMLQALETDASWEKSPFASLPVPRRGLLTELLFYEAIRAKANGQVDAMRSQLKRCIDVGYTSYIEHDMATYLLAETPP